jgi:hypothetical protein
MTEERDRINMNQNPSSYKSFGEQHSALRKANNLWTDCVQQNFMPRWLKGEAVNLNEVCVDEREEMLRMSDEAYPYALDKQPFVVN